MDTVSTWASLGSDGARSLWMSLLDEKAMREAILDGLSCCSKESVARWDCNCGVDAPYNPRVVVVDHSAEMSPMICPMGTRLLPLPGCA